MYDYSVIYQPMIDSFRESSNVMIEGIGQWVPVLLPIVGALALIDLALVVFHKVIDVGSVSPDKVSPYELDDYDWDMYEDFMDYGADFESYTHGDYDDFESYISEYEDY